MLKDSLGTLSVSIENLKIKVKNLLRQSEQYTKTDMVYLASGSFWSLVQQGTGSLTSFVVVLILTNTLPKEIFGQYRFILSIVPILCLFTLPDIGMSLYRSVARGNKVNLSEIAGVKIKWGFLGALASVILSLYYLNLGNLSLFYAFILTSAFIPFIEAFAIYLAYYKGNQDFKTAAIYESISRIFQAIVMAITALIFKDVIAILLAFFVGQLLARFFFFRKTLKNIKSLTKTSVGMDSDDNVISYGKNLSVLGVVGTVRDNWDKLLVWHFLGSEALAVYYVAFTIPNNVVLLFNVIPKIALPKFARNAWGPEENNQLVRKIYLMFFGLILPALAYVLVAPLVIPLIFNSYQASILPSLIFSATILLSPVNAMIGQVFYARKSIKNMLALQVLGMAVFTGVFLLTYESFEILGAAMAFVSGTLTNFLFGFSLIKYRGFWDKLKNR